MPSSPVRRAAPLALLCASITVGAPACAQDLPQPVFVDGQAQIVPAFADTTRWIREDLWVETEFDIDGDGRLDRVHTSVVRPGPTADGLRVPVVYASSPYYAGTGTTDSRYFWNVEHEPGDVPLPRGEMPAIAPRENRPTISNAEVGTWVPRGFAVVHSEAPGTGMSQGCVTIGGAPESLAPKAVIDWLNGRARGFTTPDGAETVSADWSTGRVGMTGTSFNGTIPVAAATTGVDGLEAIIPIAPNTSYYRYYRSEGLVRSPGGYLGEDVDVLYDFVNSGDPARRDYCDATVRDGEMAAGQDRLTGDYNDFWAARDLWNELDGIEAATLWAHGLNDWNVMPEHSVHIFQHLKDRGVPTRLFLHQGGHGGGPPLEMRNHWFTRFLYGVENGVDDGPLSWIVREGDDRSDPTAYPDYPHPQAEAVTLRAAGGGDGLGSLGPAAAAEGIERFVDDVSFSGADLAAAERSPARLLYATAPLAEAIHLSGTPRLRIRLASDDPAPNLSVWLVSLPWDAEGDTNANLINRGWADPQNTGSLRSGTPLQAGRFVDLEFPLQPDDQIIPAGQRIGLMIFGSDREFTLWAAPGTTVEIDLAGTALELPVVGGSAALGRALAGGA
ncbi:MAG: Xaa-Pro dipeptidyl-peptidase [Gemmatimonadetes bacterium]|nr:Xaa-Pro dipeptidyl-peptidase [Gemmatimonadota bacterium]